MELKHILYTFMVGVALSACTDIDESDRLLDFDIQDLKSNRCVLIEDFTGQNCVNCPDAAAEAHTILGRFPNNAIVVSVHGGPMSISVSKGGLATEIGDEYVSHWKVPSFPKGLVNRKGSTIDYQQWMSKVISNLVNDAKVNVSLENNTDTIARKTSIKVKLDATKDINGKVQVWLVENNVVKVQMTHNGRDRRYKHQHVLRDAVNGTWGEAVTLKADADKILTYEYDSFDEKWNLNEMNVVAFIYNEDEGVLQATQRSLVQQPTDNK